MIANKLQKCIYSCLKNRDSENFNRLVGIFNYMDKNTDFPYIFIAINKIDDLSNFTKKIYDFSIAINIFDKNTTNSFLFDIAEEIKAIFSDISTINSEDFAIMDIKFNSFNIEHEGDGMIWKGILSFNFIITESQS